MPRSRPRTSLRRRQRNTRTQTSKATAATVSREPAVSMRVQPKLIRRWRPPKSSPDQYHYLHNYNDSNCKCDDGPSARSIESVPIAERSPTGVPLRRLPLPLMRSTGKTRTRPCPPAASGRRLMSGNEPVNAVPPMPLLKVEIGEHDSRPCLAESTALARPVC